MTVKTENLLFSVLGKENEAGRRTGNPLFIQTNNDSRNKMSLYLASRHFEKPLMLVSVKVTSELLHRV